MTKKLGRGLLALFIVLTMILFLQVKALKSDLQVRNEVIDNLVEEGNIEQTRAFRDAIEQVKEGRKVIQDTCKKGKGLPVELFSYYCG